MAQFGELMVQRMFERAGTAPLGAFVQALAFLGHACKLFVHRDILLKTKLFAQAGPAPLGACG